MSFKSNLILNFGTLNNMYFDLLKNENFDFKTKNINISIIQNKSNQIVIDFEVDSIINLKIASSAVIKSIEIIDKTNKII